MIKHLILLKIWNYGYQCWLALMVYKLFLKKSSDRTIKNENISNKEMWKNYTNQLTES